MPAQSYFPLDHATSSMVEDTLVRKVICRLRNYFRTVDVVT